MIVHRVEILSQEDVKIGKPAGVDIYIAAEQNDNQPAEEENDSTANRNNPYHQNNNGGGTSAGRGGLQAGRPAPGGGRGGGGNMGGGGGARGGAGGGGGIQNGGGQSHPIYPIEGLSPYQNKWTIKARVTNKSDVRHWSNQKGEGKLFSCTLLDDTGEIKATGFNDTVDLFYNMLEEGKVYFISKARVGIAKKQFSNVNNEYEISLESGSEISLVSFQ